MLDVEHASVTLLGRTVVNEVSLTVPAGTWTTLVGPNGAGKTTLLRAMSGTVEHSGRIDIDGVAPGRLRARERARTVAVVPQAPTRPEGMTVLDYVLLGRTPYLPYLGVESAADLAVAGDLLDTLELRAVAARMVTSLSGGEFQRVVLARALAQEAPVLLLDEPTSSLDLGHAQQVLELVDRLRVDRGLTVVSALHDLTTAGQYADQLVLLVDGEVVARGSTREVLTEDMLSAHYGARVRIITDPEGGVVVVPLRERTRDAAARGGAARGGAARGGAARGGAARELRDDRTGAA